jgi:diguanylate cyclase (GGDEF)-like protein/PAS domain S-box-containing protein
VTQDTSGDSADLRRRALERLQHLTLLRGVPQSAHEMQRLLHELQVHQIELELQNEELRNSRSEVEAALARFTDFYDFAPVGYFTLDRRGVIVQTNPAGARLLGTERARLHNQRLSSFVASADRVAFEGYLQQVFSAMPDQAHKVELALNGKNQASRSVQIDAVLSPDGRECRAVVVDVTARKQAEARLQLAASVFTNIREGIMITDTSGIIIEVNDAFTEVTGYTREEALGQTPRILRSGHQPPEFYTAMWADLAGKGYWHGEIWNRRKNGEMFAEILTISAIRDTSGTVQQYVALFSDITTLKHHQQQLEHVAHYDALTNLPNRVLLSDRLQQAMLQCERRNLSLAVVYLDLDGFKHVNDKYGHNVGDELLGVISQRMKSALRDGDTLARLGGDEFIAVLVDLVSPKDCEPVLARILHAASEPVHLSEARLQISASIGVTIFPQDGSDVDVLMRHADQAMYQAKQTGKNRYHLFDVAQDVAIKVERESLERMQQALDRHEFVLHYQPKVNMATGQVIGVEALIRWQHPEQGLLFPASFLPIVENRPLSVALGEWVIDTALTQVGEWRAEGLDITVSVNISAFQLQTGDFPERLAMLLAQHPDIPHRYLELEILETSALEDVIQMSDVMLDCQALGVSFALDDFGTGYSSLTYLRRLPSRVLKIDQSFVRDMLEDQNDLAIVKGVIGLAMAFQREVIAEGVETVPHGELLLQLGCSLAQGYGIARPMPANMLPDWVRTWRPDAAWAV